jgi:hypothetical protein
MFKFIKLYLGRWFPAPAEPVAEVRNLNRLTQAQYDELEKQARAVTVVNQTTTDLQAGYQLGMQHVLKVVRDGWVTP